MRSSVYRIALLLAFTVGLSACNHAQPVYNVEAAAVPSDTHKLSAAKVGDVIAKAATSQGWKVSKIKSGVIHCTKSWRTHSAVAEVTYTRDAYSIELDHSTNLNQENGMIHRKYNMYVQQLQQEIDSRLASAAGK